MFFLYSLQGLTPLPIELPPSYLGLLNSAHLRFAIQLYKLEFVGKNRQGTNYDRQVVEHGDCVAYSVAGATVHAPGFASRCARLLPASLRYAETGRRDRPRFQARAAVSVIPDSLITGVSLHSPTL